MKSVLLTQFLLFTATLARPSETSGSTSTRLGRRDVEGCSRRPACCKQDLLNLGLVSTACNYPSPAPETAADLAEVCSESDGVASCCSAIVLGAGVGCAPLPPPPCTPTPGFNYSIYENPFKREPDPAAKSYGKYDNFDPAAFLKAEAFATGESYTGSVNTSQRAASPQRVYKSLDIALDQKAISGTAYLFSPVEQNITIAAYTDDIAYVYAGETAVAGFDRQNWAAYSRGDLMDIFVPFINVNYSSSITVAANSYTPLRWVVGFATLSDVLAAVFLLGLTGSVEPPTLFSSSCGPKAMRFHD